MRKEIDVQLAVERGYNCGRAQELIDTRPVGAVTPATSIPWIVRAIVFLLNRYIKGD